MNVLVTGGTGFIGSRVVDALTTSGSTVYCLTRGSSYERRIRWDPASGTFPTKVLDGTDVVLHLAGENIAAARWTGEIKSKIVASRVQPTTLIANAIRHLAHPPKIFLSASAIGFYGNRGNELVDESSGAGSGFLAEVCTQWEQAAQLASSAQTRVVLMRFGVVLDPKGGALQKMLPIFRAGLGGRIGSGAQYMSWISRRDVVAAILHCMKTDSISGPINLVTPNPVTNLEFSRILGWSLRRPTFFAVPSVIARLAFGEMADEMLLASTRVQPKKLLETRFNFLDTDLTALFTSYFQRRATQ